MLTFRQFIKESTAAKKLPWIGHNSIGWHHDDAKGYSIMYHGTHEKNLAGVIRDGIKAPLEGDTAGWVHMTHDPHTAHGYAGMTGGETNFRRATKGKRVAETVPHNKRVTLVAHIPHSWTKERMGDMKGNVDDSRDKLTNRARYDAHKAKGGTDSEYYAATELRFKGDVPAHFIQGYMKKHDE